MDSIKKYKTIKMSPLKKYMQVIELEKYSKVEDQTIYGALEYIKEYVELLDMSNCSIIIVVQFDNLKEYSELLTHTIRVLDLEAFLNCKNEDEDQEFLISFKGFLGKHEHRVSTINNFI